MSAALVTWGFESPSVAGGGGGGGAAGIRIHFVLYDDDGVPQPSIDLSAAGVTQLSLDGASYFNRHGSAPTSVGDGHYYYETHVDDGAVPPNIILKIKKTGYRLVVEEKEVVSPTLTEVRDTIVADLASSVTTIEDAIATARAELDTRINNQTTTLEADITAISSQLTSAQSAIIAEVDTRPTLSAIVSGVAAQITTDHGTGDYSTGGSAPTANQNADALLARIIEGSVTVGDALRGQLSALVGKVTDFQTGVLVFKSLDGTKTRWTITTDESGRISTVIGDLT